MLTWSPKYPDETLHYQLDWSAALAAGDSVASATATCVGATLDVVGTVGSVTTVALSGGTAGARVVVQFSGSTTKGETLGEDVTFSINGRF